MLLSQGYKQSEKKTQTEIAQLETHIVKKYAKLVYHISNQYLAVLDQSAVEDLVQIGFIALLNEFRKFEHVDCEEFKSAAAFYIRNRIRDELRSRDLLSRGQRDLLNKYKLIKGKLTHQLKREPTTREVCHVMKIDIKEVRQFEEVVIIEEEMVLSQLIHDNDDMDRELITEELIQALSTLEEIEQKVIHGLYIEGASMKEISLALDLSMNKVFRIKEKAIECLKSCLVSDLTL